MVTKYKNLLHLLETPPYVFFVFLWVVKYAKLESFFIILFLLIQSHDMEVMN